MRVIALETQNTNVPAIRFYRALGFEIEGGTLSDTRAFRTGVRQFTFDETDGAFLWLWGAPFAVASLYLGWLAIIGHRPGAWKRARLGCLGAASTGGAAFIAFFFVGTLGDFRILTGIVEGLRWSPAAATVGLIVTTLLTEKKGRRSRERRPFDS